MPKGFAFILNLLDYHGGLPLEIISGVSFQLADGAQKQQIIEYLLTSGTMGGMGGTTIYINKPRLEMPKGSWG
jgi:hypothetical protein